MEQRWISVAERLPESEMEVMVTAVRRYKDGERRYIVTPAIYEDGKMPECKSKWNWEDIDWNNCDCDVDNSIVYSCYEEESEDA